MKKLELRFILLSMTLLCWCQFAWAQQTIRGKVVDDTQQPLPGVNVLLKGTTTGTATDMNGNYSIQAPDGNGILVFSAIGFVSEEMPINNQTTINMTMLPDIKTLNEVVVTALGIEKDTRALGYSVTSIDGSLMNKARETNVINSLQGQVAGLNISPGGGGPASSSRINLRGVSNFTGGSPLFVINGVPMDNTNRGGAGEWGGSDNGDGIANINPDDIESMTVLKGATAAALYGTRAANGVILITTKGGKKNQSLSVEYNSNLQFDQVINFTDFQYVYGQGEQGNKPTDVNSARVSGLQSWGARMDGSMFTQFDGNQYPYSPVRDNIERFYRVAPSFTNTVAVSGGNETTNFRLSLSSLDSKSVLENSGVKRKTINLNVNQKITKKLDISVMANYIDQQDQNRAGLSDSPMNANFGITFLATSFNQEALKPGFDPITGDEMVYSSNIFVTNPYFVTSQYKNNIGRKRLISALTAKYQFTDWLYLQARTGYDLIHDDNFGITPWGTAYSRLGSINQNRGESTELNVDGLLGINRKLTEDLGLNIAVGANIRKNKRESIGISGSQLNIPYLYNINNTLARNQSYGFNERQVNSAYYTVDFDFRNYLTLSTSGRYDVYSTLPAANRGIFVPAVSASFVFSDLVQIPGMSFGKLRASYAQTSGEAFDAYLTSQYYSLGQPINGLPQGGFSSQLPNLNLKPFRLNEFEIGFDTKFFQNRLGVDLAYFNRKTQDEIVSGPLSITTGFTSQVLNLGSTQNTGVELLLTGTPVVTSGFSWDVSFNFTNIRNTIVDIDGDGGTTTLGLGTYRPLNANVAHVKGLAAAQIMAYDYKYDENGRVVIGDNGVPVRGELTPMGSALPKVYGGLNNSFNIRNFNVSFLFDYNFGAKVLSATNHYAIVRGLHQMTLEGRETGIVADGVTSEGSPNTVNVPAYTYYPQLATNISRLSVFDADFIKLRQLIISYRLPSSLFTRLPIEAVSVSAVGRNLATLLRRTENFDPEAGFSSDIRYAGVEGSQLPATRIYGFNLNVVLK
jgi:TonB-linked SusC/RagA family outer membrane protein